MKKAQAKPQTKGQFVYYKTAKGFYNYRLVANNGETLVVGGGTGYSSLSGCKAGIESVIKNVGVQVEDQTPQPEPEATENVPASTSTVIVFDCPVNDCTVSKDYYDNELVEDKTSGVWKTHQAIDYIGAENAEVYSVYDGTVEKVENTLMDGVVITIKHNNSIKSIYKSLGEACVSVGDSVKKGEQIGVMGTSTGEQAEGVHLHFEVMENDKLVNPNKFIATAGK